jgi:uncharacterized damage-inducible protein DinB
MSQAMSPEFAAGYCAMMLNGIKQEAEITKKVLAAVPDAKSDYKPDPNAKTGWELAWHIASTDVQFFDAIADLKFDMGAMQEEPADKPKNIAELVEWYDKNMQRGAARVAALSAEQLAMPVDFLGVYNFPAVVYLGFLNNHCIHHRGQLSSYLRPMGAKCPSIYGGSYDEPFMPPVPAESAA